MAGVVSGTGHPVSRRRIVDTVITELNQTQCSFTRLVPAVKSSRQLRLAAKGLSIKSQQGNPVWGQRELSIGAGIQVSRDRFAIDPQSRKVDLSVYVFKGNRT